MRQDSNDTITLPGTEPAEGRPDLGLPGADRPEPRPDPQDEVPERLGDQLEREPAGISSGEPDLLPNVEVPDGQM